MTPEENIEPGILHSIVDFLGDIEHLGTLGAVDKLYSFTDNEVFFKLPQSPEVLRGPLQEARKFLERMDTIVDAFHLLANVVETKLNHIKEELQPAYLHCGIQMLPDEILAHIFEDVVDAGVFEDVVDADDPPEVTLSHVCWRFRSVALDTPSLWSYVSSRMPLPWIDARLERSKGMPLSVRVDNFPPHSASERIVPHAPNWKNLQVDYVYDRNFNISSPSDIMLNLDLPNVEHFECYIKPGPWVGYGWWLDHWFSGEPWKAWKMPNVRRVHFSGPFKFLSPLAFSERLATLAYDSETCNAQELKIWLASFPNLTELKLMVSSAGDPDPSEDVLLLSKVTKFVLRTRSDKAQDTLHTRGDDVDNLALIRPECFPSVCELHFLIFFVDGVLGENFGPAVLRAVLQNLRSIERVTLDLSSSGRYTPYRQRKTIRLSSVRPRDEGFLDFIKNITDDLEKDSDMWETFETLKVRHYDWGSVERIVPVPVPVLRKKVKRVKCK